MLEDQQIFERMINAIKGGLNSLPEEKTEEALEELAERDISFDASELITEGEETKVYKIEKLEQELGNEVISVETPENLRKHLSWQTGVHKDTQKLSKGQKKKQKKLPTVESEAIQKSFNMDPFRIIPTSEEWQPITSYDREVNNQGEWWNELEGESGFADEEAVPI